MVEESKKVQKEVKEELFVQLASSLRWLLHYSAKIQYSFTRKRQNSGLG
jgi:hypothetical protein